MSEWISVKDKLPQCDMDALCFFENGQIEIMEFVGDRHVLKKGFYYHGGNPDISVTHWMLLPNPPVDLS
jgi:uncharacterized protein DUF551